MEKNRIENFSDCVFSIVATLLVIELQLPDAPTVFHSLVMIWPKILVFILSFTVVGMYWVAHHTTFNFIKQVDRNLLWLNNINLLAVIFIPFPTAVLGSHPLDSEAIILYAGTLILSNITLSLLWSYVGRHPSLVRETLTPFIANRVCWLYRIPVIIYIFAMAISGIAPWMSLAIFVLTPAFYIVPNPWFQKVTKGSIAFHEHPHKEHK